ncbi:MULTISPECIES: type I secretion system permease/ATPase [unclassified Limnobacter]|uniref:type I secretion system permease/ATPase n=1 Tax=unclassified Limnobacter TaxID=2630203 RepID=UPI000C400687|nr:MULTISPECIES: type I secretion system permease/ATPase [unclassified Limnobacter]MAG80798.1 type I secretion system permease/ATPase [Sutterellaceae bacterium]MBT83650.1 type I secretion system permease/ATPase [Sutterellaceae bacterium]|tara:strand:- start:5308 stop:7026 length:1719 start_codon:yes stop_codon:yes gene_type:complete
MLPTPESSSLLKTALQGHRRWLKVLIAFSAAINLLALTPSIYMMQVYDRVLSSQSQSTLLALTALVVGLYILAGMLEHHRVATLTRIGNALEQEFSARLHTAAFQRALKTQGKDNTGQAIRDFSAIRQFMTSQGAIALFDTPWVLFYIALLFAFHPLFGLMALCCVAISITLSWLHLRSTRPFEEQTNALGILSANTMNSTLQNANSIQAMGMLPTVQTEWLSIQKEQTNHHTGSADASSVWTNSSKYFRMFVQSAALGLGAYLVLNQSLSGGMMIAASILMGKALAPVDMLSSAAKALTGTRQAYERLNKLLNNSPQTLELTELPTPKPVIECRNMYLAAPLSGLWLLKNILLQIPAGSTVGVIGPSGSGKTSLLHALAGILPIAQGRLEIDGADIAQYPRSQLGAWTGYLAQHVELFEGTVAQNIGRFEHNNDEHIVQAAMAAGVHELVLKLPKGYNTPLGAQGEGLSGGMRQRIGLARALYKKPQLLLLDEPNAHLDEAGEAALANALVQHQQHGNTAIVVTHKKSILRVCNKLLVLRDGEVSVYGNTHEVLTHLQQQPPTQLTRVKNA